MPMCTYLGDTEHLGPTGHKAIDEAVADLRKQTGEDWRAGVFTTEQRRWFRKPVKRRWYSLYINIGFGEFQCINFFRDGTDWSINPDVTAELIVAYVNGYLGGDWQATRRHGKNAARYLFLRDTQEPGPLEPRAHVIDQQQDAPHCRFCHGEELDAAIDTALAAQPDTDGREGR